ncbi:MAG: cyclic nucleotide-binding domain-containing protein [Spirochaetales bacterium]|nr:cyclic nucleotide-binding domain-containing protein [Spirochaetales bacterium]
MELFGILKNNSIFGGLTDDEIKSIVAICTEQKFESGSVIFEENSEGSGMYILVKGQVDIQMSMGADDELATVHVIHEGEIFGELTLVDRATRSATAKAAGPALAFVLDADRFDGLCGENNRIGLIVMRNIARIVTARLRETNIKYTESLIWERLGSDPA